MAFRLLNRYEEVTYHRVKEVTDRVSSHVFPKVRMADVLPINQSGISKSDFSYALMAHFDFVVTDADSKPLFAIEFDGPTHRDAKQMAKDDVKDRIATLFELPLLRINAKYVEQRYRGLDLLTYFVEVWFLRDSFNEAQRAGHISWDEPFDPTYIIHDSTHKRQWPYWLSLRAQTEIEKLFKAELVESPGANCWVGIDGTNRFRCLAWVQLHNGATCFVKTGMRSQRFPANESDVLEQIAVVDLRETLTKVLNGKTKPQPAGSLEREFAFYNSHFKRWASSLWSRPD